jgi:hypothetical protein
MVNLNQIEQDTETLENVSKIPSFSVKKSVVVGKGEEYLLYKAEFI